MTVSVVVQSINRKALEAFTKIRATLGLKRIAGPVGLGKS